MYCWTPEVFVTGISGSYGITIGYDENGDVLTGWPRYNSNSEFYSLAVDFNGNIAVSGTDENETDLVTVQYDDAGNENFNLTCTTYASYGHTVTVDDNGLVYAAGRVLNCSLVTCMDYLTIKYNYSGNDNQMALLNNNGNLEKPKAFSLSQNYPNPFNPSTVIRYSIPVNSYVTLKVYNILGQPVAILVNYEYKNSGYYEVKFDGTNLPSGIYFYTIQAGKYFDTKKMLMVK